MAKQYDGALALGLNLSTSVKLEPRNLKLRMYQGRNVLEPYACNLNSASQRDMQILNKNSGELEDNNVWDLQYFVYFDLSKLDPQRTMVLAATDEYAGTREFVLKLPAMN